MVILSRWKTAFILMLLAAGSAWLLNKLIGTDADRIIRVTHDPDYYMKNFKTTTMNQDGLPKNILSADFMAHYPDNDTTELQNPRLEVFRKDELPLNIIADKGWVTENNEVVLLTGNVKFWQDDIDGIRKLEINTTDVRILPKQDYAETDKPVQLITKRTTVNSLGIRAFFDESRVELLNNVQAKILPEQTD
jgi:lipopolysaccharide export system protein LptC